MDAFVMLQELLEQEQFELIFPERSISGQPDIRLVYLMNDAVESFLVFHNARMTGEYRPDYEGEISASMSFEDMEYILVVHQGDSVVTIFFEDLLTDVHLYDYGEIGHFWMKDYEYLRQLEYRLAIMRDKYDYLGGEYCTPEERKLAMLVDFPPLNYCCYPAVPEQYSNCKGRKEFCYFKRRTIRDCKDSIGYQIHLMIWEKGILNRKVKIESYSLEKNKE
mgnify:CR=1 FL=1